MLHRVGEKVQAVGYAGAVLAGAGAVIDAVYHAVKQNDPAGFALVTSAGALGAVAQLGGSISGGKTLERATASAAVVSFVISTVAQSFGYDNVAVIAGGVGMATGYAAQLLQGKRSETVRPMELPVVSPAHSGAVGDSPAVTDQSTPVSPSPSASLQPFLDVTQSRAVHLQSVDEFDL